MKQSTNIGDEFERLKSSFPKTLEFEVESLFSVITVHYKCSAYWGYEIILKENNLEIPSRIYWEEHRLREPRDLSPISRTILACILTRHHNGYIREKYLLYIISSNEYWITPYLIQILGEYVIELLHFVWNNFDLINQNNLVEFVKTNDQFWYKTKQRIESYWDCYHSYKTQEKEDYIGFRLIKKIEQLVKEKTLQGSV